MLKMKHASTYIPIITSTFQNKVQVYVTWKENIALRG